MVNAFPDTSFLCALYVPLAHSPRAVNWMAAHKPPLAISPLVFFEFRTSLRLQVFRWKRDRTQGFSEATAAAAFSKLKANHDVGALATATIEFAHVLDLAEQVSSQHAVTEGNRSMDILHVATALHLGAETFLTFDARQKSLAESVGLKVGPV